jgi:hypothetical protein
MTVPLEVFAQLSVLADSGESLSVQAQESIIAIESPNLRVFRVLLRQLPGRERRKTSLDRLHMGLRRSDLILEVRIARQVVAQLRPQSRPTLWSRLLGLGSLELRLFPLLLAVLKSSR